MVIFSSSVIWASTWPTRVSIGALEPTQGQAAEPPSAAVAGAVAGRVNAAVAATTATVAQSFDLSDRM